MTATAGHGSEPASVPADPFWDGCRRGVLTFQRCTTCGDAAVDRAAICRSCRAATLVSEESAGRGVVYSWSTVWRAPNPSFDTPYVVIIAELAEGFRLVSSLIDCEHATVHSGMPIRVVFRRRDGLPVPYFVPAELDARAGSSR